MPQTYMDTVVQIMERGQKNNSYKMALLRSLAALGLQPETKAEIITFEWLAKQFIRFYWPLALRFNIRQATVPDKDPVVMRLIRNEAAKIDISPEIS